MPLFWMTTSAMRVSPGASGEAGTGRGVRSRAVLAASSFEDADSFSRAKISTLRTPLPSMPFFEEVDELSEPARRTCNRRGLRRVAAEPAMRDECAVLGAGVLRVGGERLARHVAGLAGGDGVLAVEGKRRLFGEAGALPLVVDGEGAEPLVVVERAGDGGLVAGGAELGGLVERAHHGLASGDRDGRGFRSRRQGG